MVSHICLLLKLGPICNSMAASLCLKSFEDHSLLKSYNGGLWKIITGMGFALHMKNKLNVFITYEGHPINRIIT